MFDYNEQSHADNSAYNPVLLDIDRDETESIVEGSPSISDEVVRDQSIDDELSFQLGAVVREGKDVIQPYTLAMQERQHMETQLEVGKSLHRIVED